MYSRNSILLVCLAAVLTACGGGGGGGGSDGTIPPAPVANSTPIANAGSDQYVFTGTTAALDGSASKDVNGDTLTFNWNLRNKPLGSNAKIAAGISSNTSIVPDIAGVYTVDLVVSDGKTNGTSTAASIVINAVNPNEPLTYPYRIAKWNVRAYQDQGSAFSLIKGSICDIYNDPEEAIVKKDDVVISSGQSFIGFYVFGIKDSTIRNGSFIPANYYYARVIPNDIAGSAYDFKNLSPLRSYSGIGSFRLDVNGSSDNGSYVTGDTNRYLSYDSFYFAKFMNQMTISKTMEIAFYSDSYKTQPITIPDSKGNLITFPSVTSYHIVKNVSATSLAGFQIAFKAFNDCMGSNPF